MTGSGAVAPLAHHRPAKQTAWEKLVTHVKQDPAVFVCESPAAARRRGLVVLAYVTR